MGPINNIPALVQIMAWRRPGDKPLSEPMITYLLTHICVTRPQWINLLRPRLTPCGNKDIGSGYAGIHDDVIKWKHFPRNWPFVRGIHRSPVNSPHKGQWRGALMFSLICVWINDWVNNRAAGDLRRYRARYDVSVMYWWWSPLFQVMVCCLTVSHYLNQCWFIVNQSIRNTIQILIEIRIFSFKQTCLKMSSAIWQPFCWGDTVLEKKLSVDFCFKSEWSSGPQSHI